MGKKARPSAKRSQHLPELSHEELASLSERVRRYRSASRQNMLLSLCYT